MHPTINPVMTGHEEMYMNTLKQAAAPDGFYPGTNGGLRRIAQNLTEIHALEERLLQRSERGAPAKHYAITESGTELLQQLQDWFAGRVLLPPKARHAINLWRNFMPARYVQYLVTVALISSEHRHNAIGILQQQTYIPKHRAGHDLDLVDPVALAVVNYLQISRFNDAYLADKREIFNHCSAEVGTGKTLYSRLSELEKDQFEIIAGALGTDSEAYVVSWLLTIGALIARP